MVVPMYFSIYLDQNVKVLGEKKNCIYFGGFIGLEKAVTNLFLFVVASGCLHMGARIIFL